MVAASKVHSWPEFSQRFLRAITIDFKSLGAEPSKVGIALNFSLQKENQIETNSFQNGSGGLTVFFFRVVIYELFHFFTKPSFLHHVEMPIIFPALSARSI